MKFCPQCGAEAVDGARFCPACGNVLPAATNSRAPADPLIHRTLDSKFLIQELLGVGGMGRVYKAVQLSLDKVVCVKVLRPGMTQDETLVRRFQREARAASRLNHPNSITVIDFGQAKDDGSLYLAMEFVPGKDLNKVIATERPLSEKRVVHIMDQVLSALADAHAAGIIHRDLKPENIMVAELRGTRDFVKVLDFGIAKIQESAMPEPGLTQAGMVCGTPEYMSPEQARGEELDARSDIYAAGVILYQMVTGQLPFTAPTAMGIVTKHLMEPPVPPSQLPGVRVSPALEAVILKAMSKDRSGRQPTAIALQQELAAVLSPVVAPAQEAPLPKDLFSAAPPSQAAQPMAGQPTLLRPASSPAPASARPAPMPAKSSRFLWAMLAALLVLGGGGTAAYLLLRPPPEAPRVPDGGPVALPDAGGSHSAEPAIEDAGAVAAEEPAAAAVDGGGAVAAAADAAGEAIPEQAVAFYNLGKELMARQEVDKACKTFEKAIRAAPSYAAAYKAAGACLVQLGETERAKKHYQGYLEHAPPDAPDREAIQQMIDAM